MNVMFDYATKYLSRMVHAGYLRWFAAHPNRDKLRKEYPELEDEDIRQALEYIPQSRCVV